MSVKPILFNTEMVQVILSGRKTATRRPIKPTDKNADHITVLFNDRNEIVGAVNSKSGAPISDVKERKEIEKTLLDEGKKRGTKNEKDDNLRTDSGIIDRLRKQGY